MAEKPLTDHWLKLSSLLWIAGAVLAPINAAWGFNSGNLPFAFFFTTLASLIYATTAFALGVQKIRNRRNAQTDPKGSVHKPNGQPSWRKVVDTTVPPPANVQKISQAPSVTNGNDTYLTQVPGKGQNPNPKTSTSDQQPSNVPDTPQVEGKNMFLNPGSAPKQ